MTRTAYIKPGKLLDAYAAQDADGAWVIVKVYAGHTDVSAYTVPTQADAERMAGYLLEARPCG